jgi:hypothetical protein
MIVWLRTLRMIYSRRLSTMKKSCSDLYVLSDNEILLNYLFIELVIFF